MEAIKRRIGKDLTIKLSVMTNGEAISLEGRNLRVEAKHEYLVKACQNLIFTVSGNQMTIKWYGKDHKHLGNYNIVIWENYNGTEQTAVDICQKIELVESTCLEGDTGNGLDVESIDLGVTDLAVGIKGSSAYEIWLQLGHEGTEEDFMLCLQEPARTIANEVAKSEEARQTAENLRKENEALRVSAESARVGAEQSRVVAESARESAEAKRQQDTAAAIKNAEKATTAANDAADKANAAANRADEGANNLGIEDYPEFSAEKSYIVGDVVRYSGKLYRFTVAHPAGAWTGTDTEQTSVKEELDRAVAMKANVDGYYETMRVGTADNLTARGDASEEIIMSRKTGGDNVIDSGDASIKSIKGNSVVMTQLINVQKIVALSGSSVIFKDNVIESTGDSSYIGHSISYIEGHHYFLYLSVYDTTGKVNIYFDTEYTQVYGFSTDKESYLDKYIIVKATGLYNRLAVGLGTNLRHTTYLRKSINLIDLTRMFGAGNEPATAEEFAHRLGYDSIEQVPYIPYNEGEIVSCKAEGVRSTGRNLWDEQWELGIYSIDTGHPITSQKNIRCKNAVPVIPGSQLYFKKIHWSLWYDINDNFLKYDFVQDNVITVPDDAHYCRFYFVEEYGTIYKNNACINISDSSFNGQYEPYDSNERKWTSTLQKYFPDGLKSAGTIYDEITSTKAVKRIGSVDLGEFNWEKLIYDRYITTVPIQDMKKVEPDSISNILTIRYKPSIKSIVEQEDMQIATDGQYIIISNRSANDIETLKASLQGAICYYELATPEEYTYDELNLTERVAPGGIEEAIVSEGVLSTPLKIDVVYPIDTYGTIVNNKKNIGNISQLQTEAKTDLVVAINELKTQLTQLSAATEPALMSLRNDVDGLISDLGGAEDMRELPAIAGQPLILFGHGAPAKDVVPDNWRQFDPATGKGYEWNGTPSALGQQYLDVDASPGGLYIAARDTNMGLKWINC